MRAEIDHVGVTATDPEAAGLFLAQILGEGDLVPDGPPDDDSGDMFSLLLDGWSLAFVRVPEPAPIHLAIRVAPEGFAAAVERLRAAGIAYGNDPEDPANGRTDDFLGGPGRAYFKDPDGNLYELVVVVPPTSET